MEFYYETSAIGIDSSLDFNDATDHMNQYGCEKFSDYISVYLKSEFNLSDYRGILKRWDEDLVYYHEYKKEQIK